MGYSLSYLNMDIRCAPDGPEKLTVFVPGLRGTKAWRYLPYLPPSLRCRHEREPPLTESAAFSSPCPTQRITGALSVPTKEPGGGQSSMVF